MQKKISTVKRRTGKIPTIKKNEIEGSTDFITFENLQKVTMGGTTSFFNEAKSFMMARNTMTSMESFVPDVEKLSARFDLPKNVDFVKNNLMNLPSASITTPMDPKLLDEQKADILEIDNLVYTYQTQ